MQDIHQDPPAAPVRPPLVHEAAAWHEHADYPLGCECADPALQIEAWREQADPH